MKVIYSYFIKLGESVDVQLVLTDYNAKIYPLTSGV